MTLTDWIVILAVALMTIAFLCARAGQLVARKPRARRLTITRLLVQATLALWSALFIVQCDVFALDDIAGLHPAPHTVLAGAVILIAAGCYCSVRGRRLLKPRRLFGALVLRRAGIGDVEHLARHA